MDQFFDARGRRISISSSNSEFGAKTFIIGLTLGLLALSAVCWWRGYVQHKIYEDSGKENKGAIAKASIAWIFGIVFFLIVAFSGLWIILLNEIFSRDGLLIITGLGFLAVALWGAIKLLIEYQESGEQDKGKLAGSIIIWIGLLAVAWYIIASSGRD